MSMKVKKLKDNPKQYSKFNKQSMNTLQQHAMLYYYRHTMHCRSHFPDE